MKHMAEVRVDQDHRSLVPRPLGRLTLGRHVSPVLASERRVKPPWRGPREEDLKPPEPFIVVDSPELPERPRVKASAQYPHKAIMLQPFEVVVNRLLPTIRARLAQVLLEEYHMKQVEVAKRLGLTQAAVSHYNTRSRGADEEILTLFPEIDHFVAELSGDIVQGITRQEQVARLNSIVRTIMNTERFCNFHRKLADLGECLVCFESPVRISPPH